MKATIKTKPVAKARPRFSRFGAYTPKKTLDYEKLIRDEFLKQCKEECDSEYIGAISIEINFYIEIPKSYSKIKRMSLIGKPQLKRPDLDNYIKAIFDALNGIAWKDDSQIFFISASKQYAEENLIDITIDYIKGE